MIYEMGGGILYIIVLVVILRILKRSAILRDKGVFDDAPQWRKQSSFLLNPNTLANNITASRGQICQETTS